MTNMAKPFVKWAGGKKQLVKEILEIINKNNLYLENYYEPFLGGGALFFSIDFHKAVINDLNAELINSYNQIKENLDELISELSLHKKSHNKEYYYKIRGLDRDESFVELDPVKKAARTIYLNKTCYNGLYRVNSNGYFNTPIGSYVNPQIYSEDNLNLVSSKLKKDVKLTSLDFRTFFKMYKPPKGSLIYFDPPYDYEDQNGFVGYVSGGFTRDDLKDLHHIANELIDSGCYVIISNNNTKFVRELFGNDDHYKIKVINDSRYKIKVVNANRLINSKAIKRKSKVEEVLIYGRNISAGE